MLNIGMNRALSRSKTKLISRAHIIVPFGHANKALDEGTAGADDVHGNSSVCICLEQLFDSCSTVLVCLG